MEFQTKPDVDKLTLDDEEHDIEIWMIRSAKMVAKENRGAGPLINEEQGMRIPRKMSERK